MLGITRSSRSVTVLAVAFGAIALAPAAASASITYFGSNLNHTPANSGSTCAEDGVMGASLCTHVGSFYPGNSGRAQSPVNGTIVAIQTLPAGPMTMTVKLVNVRHLAADHKSAQAAAVAKSKTIDVPGPTADEISIGDIPIETFFVQMKVKKGQELAIDTTSNTAEYCSDGTPGQLLYDPVLSLGHAFRPSQGVDGCLMLIRAVVER
jgi:hypothetical protein